MSAAQFYQKHLDRVSRSFALCIAKLESPLREQVGLTYLICRILDTVEDAPWENSAQQLEQFHLFDHFLKKHPESGVLSLWVESFPAAIPEAEEKLLEDSGQIFADLHGLPESVRSVLQEMIGSMSAGMQYFARRKQRGIQHLQSLQEVNQYCFFVAGIVGEALVKLLELQDVSLHKISRRYVEAHHFGQFLQKVNLLKDQIGDQQEGRFWVHSRQELLLSLVANAQGAIAFLRSLPNSQKSFRLFCAWSFFLGLESLVWSQRAYENGRMAKVPREHTQSLFSEIESVIDDNEALLDLFEAYLHKLTDVEPSILAMMEQDILVSEGVAESPSGANTTIDSVEGDEINEELEWLKSYRGRLRGHDLKELGCF